LIDIGERNRQVIENILVSRSLAFHYVVYCSRRVPAPQSVFHDIPLASQKVIELDHIKHLDQRRGGSDGGIGLGYRNTRVVYPWFSECDGASQEIVKLILNAKIELAVMASPFLSPLLEMEWFRKERLAAFVANDHPLARRKQIGRDEFAVLPLIIRGRPNQRNRTDEFLCALFAQGVRANIHERLESAKAVMTAVKNGVGVGILYYDVIKSELDRGQFKILRLTGARSYL
jgi:hypothetical protein